MKQICLPLQLILSFMYLGLNSDLVATERKSKAVNAFILHALELFNVLEAPLKMVLLSKHL